MHELGHALGLGHAQPLTESTDLMGYGWHWSNGIVPTLSECDLDGIALRVRVGARRRRPVSPDAAVGGLRLRTLGEGQPLGCPSPKTAIHDRHFQTTGVGLDAIALGYAAGRTTTAPQRPPGSRVASPTTMYDVSVVVEEVAGPERSIVDVTEHGLGYKASVDVLIADVDTDVVEDGHGARSISRPASVPPAEPRGRKPACA